MALGANALTTLQDVKLELDIPSTDVSDDLYLEGLINATSMQVETFLQRQLERVTNFEEMVPGFGNYKLRVSRTPVLSVSAIEMIAAASPPIYYEFDLAALQIEGPETGLLYYPAGWPWTVPIPPGTIGQDPRPGQEWPSIKVTYDAGYDLPASATPTLPIGIQRATTVAVTSEFRMRGRDRNIKSEKLMSYSVTYEKTGMGEATLHKLYPASPFSAAVTQMLVPHRHIPGA
jgi:hypothetical protein